jgi:predicted AAA+ superfamily ATPase
MQLTRYLSQHITEDLRSKMVFIGGPRQVGKTTISLQYLPSKCVSDPGYLNWDHAPIRQSLLQGNIPPSSIIVLDEIHKYSEWKNLVKGLFDTRKNKQNFLVTGSAKLDYFNKSGDSMQGRYHYYRLHPFSLPELNQKATIQDVEQLFTFGGFPEPLFKQNSRMLRRWQNERIRRVIHDDLRDLSTIHDINALELLVAELPNRICSPLSINNLAMGLRVSHPTMTKWLDMLDAMYISFRISPFGSPKFRAVKKEQKLYLWDWSVIEKPSARFENMVASQLLKYCHYMQDWEGYNMELRYIRDTDQREIDFVVIKDQKPMFAVECKLNDSDLSPSIKYFRDRSQIPNFYQVHMGTHDYVHVDTGCRILPFNKFCSETQMV